MRSATAVTVPPVDVESVYPSPMSHASPCCRFVRVALTSVVPAIVMLYAFLILACSLRDKSDSQYRELQRTTRLFEGEVIRETCDTPFGSLIGLAHGVPAYSNCNSDFTSNESNFINVSLGASMGVALNVYTGMPWQCVEYGRRFWAMTSPHAVFGSVDGAADIWTQTYGHYLTPGSSSNDQSEDASSSSSRQNAFQLLKYQNANTSVAPQIGDLIIYPIQGGGFPFGHVAAIVGTDFNSTEVEALRLVPTNDGGQPYHFSVMVGEQNWDSYHWANEAKNYSRAIAGTFHILSNRYSLHDPEGIIQGWVRRQ